MPWSPMDQLECLTYSLNPSQASVFGPDTPVPLSFNSRQHSQPSSMGVTHEQIGEVPYLELLPQA